MRFNTHSEVKGKHAFLSPSQYHWLNYDDQKLHARFISAMAAAHGTKLHDLAQDLIELRVRLPDEPETLNMYVNDAIDFGLSCEVSLYYSDNAFGHADTIGFEDLTLRIADLKTGITEAKFTQLEVYAALFCLEYGMSPHDIDIILRIYQNDEIREHEPYSDRIDFIMERIVDYDQKIEQMREDLR